MNYDVVILGGGPAAAATALALRAQTSRSVAMIERSTYALPRIGETIPPSCSSLLQQLDVWEAFLRDGHAPSHGTAACWGSETPGYNDFFCSPFGQGWHLDRRRFDSLLAREAVRRGAVLYTGSQVVEHRRSPGGTWRLKLRNGCRLAARFVVDATGRHARFAQEQGANKVRFDELVGLYVFFQLEGDRALEGGTLVEAIEQGWWYSAALPNRRMAVALMSDADLVKRGQLRDVRAWSALLDRTTHTKRRVAHAKPLNPPVVHAAHSQRLDRVAGDGWLAVGDAACTFDPLSSLGISKALRSGLAAASAIASCFRDSAAGLNEYEASGQKEFESYLDTRAGYYALETRWLSAPFWTRRHERITLDPREIVQPAENGRPASQRTMYLSPDQWNALHRLCLGRRPAHEVVSEFKAQHGHALTDKRIILALQHLVQHGVLFTGKVASNTLRTTCASVRA